MRPGAKARGEAYWRFLWGEDGSQTGDSQRRLGLRAEAGSEQASQWEGDIHSPLPCPAWLSSARPVIRSSSWVGRRHGGQPGCCVKGVLGTPAPDCVWISEHSWFQVYNKHQKVLKMNGQPSPVFEEKKPSLPVVGSSISATKDSPTLPESSSTDMGFYSGQSALHGSQDFYPAQQPYSTQHMNPYAYHPYNLNGMGPGGAYPVGKAEYPYPHATYREHGAFSSREVQSLQDSGELNPTRKVKSYKKWLITGWILISDYFKWHKCQVSCCIDHPKLIYEKLCHV